MSKLTPSQSEAWSLMEGYCDVVLATAKDRVAELLNCDVSDVDAELAGIGVECCGECRVWHAQSDCNIDHPDDSTLFVCQSCVEHLGVEI